MPKRKQGVEFKSPASFFADNKTIAGFDNPGKSLYTTIREFVENSLDAAESCGRLPHVAVRVEELTQAQLHAENSIAEVERVNESLYAPSPAGGAAGKDKLFYRVSCKDNGTGMPHDAVPDMLGTVLAGTKYGVRQMRGKYGLGAKMALIWSKMSSGLPIHVRTALDGDTELSECVLDIDIERNKPNVRRHERAPLPDGWVGTEISVTIEGNFSAYRHHILQYMRQLAIITPYARLHLEFAHPTRGFALEFERRSGSLPPPPKVAKHHPASANLVLLEQLARTSPEKTFKRFLSREFSSISLAKAGEIVEELGLDQTTPMPVSDKTIARLARLFHEMAFDKPSADCLSPAGEYNLRLGVIKELEPELVATHAEPAGTYEGHPFVVEAAVSIGGDKVQPGISVNRFANRIPLLFEGGGDVVTRSAHDIPWTQYKINKTTDRIGVFVSIVSTKIPFKGTGKEYIGADIIEIKDAVHKAIRACCLQLKAKIVRRLGEKDKSERRRNLIKYVPGVAKSVAAVVGSADEGKLRDALLAYVDKHSADNLMEHGRDKGSSAAGAYRFFIPPRAGALRWVGGQYGIMEGLLRDG